MSIVHGFCLVSTGGGLWGDRRVVGWDKNKANLYISGIPLVVCGI